MDSLLELEINDGRRPASKAARKWDKELLRRKIGWYGKKYKPEQDFERAPLVSKYRLMFALQVLVLSGHTTYLTDYLSVSNSLRADMRALNLSDMLPNAADAGKDKSDSKEGSAVHDLSVLSVPELKVLRFLMAKLHGESTEGSKNIYDDLLEMARSLRPVSGLIEYHPVEKKEELKVRRTKQPKPEIIEMQSTAISTEGETPAEREERIQYHHWLKMRKGLQKDPDPWDL